MKSSVFYGGRQASSSVFSDEGVLWASLSELCGRPGALIGCSWGVDGKRLEEPIGIALIDPKD